MNPRDASQLGALHWGSLHGFTVMIAEVLHNLRFK